MPRFTLVSAQRRSAGKTKTKRAACCIYMGMRLIQMRFCQRAPPRWSFTCIRELHARTALTRTHALARLACDTSENHLVSHDASALSENEAAGRAGPPCWGRRGVGGGMRWRQQKSFEEVDVYLQGHIPPSRSKRLEDVFDGETMLLFQSAVAQRRGSHCEGHRAILIWPPVT